MEKSLKSLRGLPVLCAGRRVGRVAQAALSKDLRRMEGLWVDAGLWGARFVPSESIQLLGEVSVTVDGPGSRRRMCEPPLFRRVVTTDGARLGAVVGATVDCVSFQVTSLRVCTGYWDDLVRGRLSIGTLRPPPTARKWSRTCRQGRRSTMKSGTIKECRRGAAGRRGGDAVRRDELADGAQVVHAGAAHGR